MGVSHSGHPRSVNMENQTPVGVVEVSEDVVKRLKLGLGKEAKKHTATSVSESESTIENPISVPKQPPQIAAPVVYVDQSPSLMELRRQKVQELQKIDTYWKNRLAELERNLNKTNKVMEDEYSAAIEDVKKRFSASQLYPSHELSSLQDLKTQLITCFRVNRGEPLKCSEEVTAFTNCVSKYRVQKLDENDKTTLKPGIEKPKALETPVKAA